MAPRDRHSSTAAPTPSESHAPTPAEPHAPTAASAHAGTPVSPHRRAAASASPAELRLALAETQAQLELARDQLAAANRRLDETQHLAGLGSWERDLNTGETVWSDEMFRIQGVEPGIETPTNELASRLTHPDDRERRAAWLQDVIASAGGELEEHFRTFSSTGEVRTIRVRAKLQTGDGTTAPRLIGTIEDVTDELRGKHAEAVLSQIVQSASQAILTVDRDLAINSWNPAAERLYGYTAAEAIGRSIDILIPDDLSESARNERRARQRRMLDGMAEMEEVETRRRRKDGTVIEVHSVITPLRDYDGKIVGLVSNVRDITDRKRAEETVAHLATHDAHTGLYNRHRFDEELSAASARSEHEGLEGAVLTLDLDSFKYVNDTYGHNTGDELVTGIAHAIEHVAGPNDVIARLGGDEFGVLSFPCSAGEARRLAERLLDAVRRHELSVGDHTVRATASVGVATFGGEFAPQSSTPAELMADSDRAMYESKESGRNRITIYTGAERIDVRRRRSTAGEHLIRDALQHDRFELFAQPIVNLSTNVMSHVEMLLRLRNDDKLISPGDFLPAAERLGLIHLVDYWVISHSLEVAAAHPDLIFDINLSGATIEDPRLEGFISQELRNSGVSPSRIVFELTETAAVRNIARARELSRHLSDMGCRFAIDDFGAGFSTFYYLKHIPADYLKIDGEFMNDPRSRMDELVIQSIVRIADDLGKQTIAEYVADEQTLDRVRSLGVDFGQGYHFAKPFPVSQLADLPRRLGPEQTPPAALRSVGRFPG